METNTVIFLQRDGRFIKTTKGRHETGGYGPFKFTYWNPFATNTEDKTGEIMAGLDSALQSRFESSGVKKQEDIIGFLTGSQKEMHMDVNRRHLRCLIQKIIKNTPHLLEQNRWRLGKNNQKQAKQG